ncbi:MAG TPA: cytochrome c [Xanthobacteraceae bacterium]
MQKAAQLSIGLAFIASAVAIFLALAPLPAKGKEVLSPAAQRGLVIVRTNCSRCHAIGKVGDSPLPIAPPLRTLHERYPVDDLQEPLAEGIITGHPTMPEFRFDPGQVGDIIAYLKSLER